MNISNDNNNLRGKCKEHHKIIETIDKQIRNSSLLVQNSQKWNHFNYNGTIFGAFMYRFNRSDRITFYRFFFLLLYVKNHIKSENQMILDILKSTV